MFVVQVAPGFVSDFVGDPAMAIVAPAVGHVKSTHFLALPSSIFPKSFITVTVFAKNFDQALIQLDDSQLGCTWTDIFNINDEVVGHGCTASIGSGTHVISHKGENGALSVITCGWTDTQQIGYAYLTGLKLQVPELPTEGN